MLDKETGIKNNFRSAACLSKCNIKKCKMSKSKAICLSSEIKSYNSRTEDYLV